MLANTSLLIEDSIMAGIRPIQDIDSYMATAIDLSSLLQDPANEDIGMHFPGTVSRYSGSFDAVAANLREAADQCETGKREQFIAFSGGVAVGMSIVTNQVESPEGVDDSWPNLSGFVLNPYRNQGIGRLAMEHRIKVVERNFGGHAWTYVRKGNIPAEKIVTGAGFKKTDTVVPGQEHQNLYLY
jgi:GNAT superfamily N-acetyltransferase